MIIWIAIVTACSTPAAISCQSLVKPEVFYEEQACLDEVAFMLEYLTRKGVMNNGRCVAVKSGNNT